MADVGWVLTSKELKERQGETQRYNSETRRPIRSLQPCLVRVEGGWHITNGEKGEDLRYTLGAESKGLVSQTQ